jgi:hypothetical protein
MSVKDSQSTTFTFNSVTYEATNIQVSTTGAQQIDVTSLATAGGGSRVFQAGPLHEVGGSEISVDFFGYLVPDCTAMHALAIASSNGGVSFSGNAICKSYNVTAAVGELLKGSATFALVAQDRFID